MTTAKTRKQLDGVLQDALKYTGDIAALTAGMEIDIDTPSGMVKLARLCGKAYGSACMILQKTEKEDGPEMARLEKMAKRLIQNLTKIWVDQFDRLCLTREKQPGDPDIRITLTGESTKRALELYYGVEPCIRFIAEVSDNCQSAVMIGKDDIGFPFIRHCMEGTRAVLDESVVAQVYHDLNLSMKISD